MNRLQRFLTIVTVSVFLGLSPSANAHHVPQTWCTHAGTERIDVKLRAFTGALCVDRARAHKWVATRDAFGHFTQVWEDGTSRWCSHADARIYFADINNDGYPDLICRDPRRIWVDLYQRGWPHGHEWYQGTNFEQASTWCTHAGAQFVGFSDENVDGRADMVCRTSEGYYWTSHVDGRGFYAGTSAEGFRPDLRVNSAIRIAEGSDTITLRVEIENLSPIAATITSLLCASRLGERAAERIPAMPGLGRATVEIQHWRPATLSDVVCRVASTTASREPELVISNNAAYATPF